MMGRTHILIGVGSLWILTAIPHTLTPEVLAPLAASAALGALLPDLDANSSTVKQLSVARIYPFAPVAVILSRDLGHRGATHSLLGLCVFVLLMLPVGVFLGWPMWAALSLGYASHLVADACTKSGIPLLHPSRKRYHLLPQGWRFTTGSLAEDALMPLVALIVLSLLFTQLQLLHSPPFS